MTTLMNFDVSGEPANSQQLPPLTEEQRLLQRLAAGETRAFWHLFEQYRDYLLRCCLKWTNGNLTAAEDLLSQGMLKAWEKAQKYAGKIDNFKSWVTTLTRNFWLDLKRRPCAKQVEDIEVYAEQEDLGWVAVGDTPGKALEQEEKNRVIRAAIDELPTKMRETFILHFYEELSHQEIVARQGISYANVCKRISQAREILRPKLRGYFIGDADTKSDTIKVAAKPVKSQKAVGRVAKVEAVLPETEPSNYGVNTEYSNPELEEETGFLPPTESQGDTTDQEAIGLHQKPTQTPDFIQGQGDRRSGRSPQRPYHYPTLRNRVSVRNLTGETEILVETRFLDPHLLSFPRRRESIISCINISIGRTLRNRVSVRNLTGETEILVETRFLDPHLLSFPRRRESIIPGINISTGRTLRNRVFVRNLTGETEILVETRFLDPHLLSFPRRRESIISCINTSRGRTLRNRVSVRNLTGETEILVETRFLDPHLLSFPRRRESIISCINISRGRTLRNRVSVRNLTGETEILVETRFLDPHLLSFPRRRESIISCINISRGRTLRNRVSVRNLTGETEILVETRFLDPHLLSFPRRRESIISCINTSTNIGIDSS